MRLHVDLDRCAASGSCARVAPAVFHLEGGRLRVLDASPPTALADDVAAAAALCPTGAITVVD